MYSSLLSIGLLWIVYITSITSTSLSFVLNSNEECFYALSPKVDQKIGFYFSVQTGGKFDLNFVAKDPKGKVVVDGVKQKQGDYVFAAQEQGEYSFCFSNDEYLGGSKRVYIDITVEDEHLTRPSLSTPTTSSTSDTTEIENAVFRLDHLLTTYTRNQKYYRTRENRNVDTVVTTQERIWWFAVLTSMLVVGMSLAQVYVVRAFFSVTTRRKI